MIHLWFLRFVVLFLLILTPSRVCPKGQQAWMNQFLESRRAHGGDMQF